MANNPPWLASYPPDITWDFAVPNLPVHQLLKQSSTAHPNRIYLDFLGKTYTYQEIQTLVDQLAAGLQQQSLGQGSRIGLCLPNCPYFIIAYFAILQTGATVVNFNPLYTAEELAHQIEDADIQTMFIIDVAEICEKIVPELGKNTFESLILCPLVDVLPPLKKHLYKLAKHRQIYQPKSRTIQYFKDLLGAPENFIEPTITPHTDTAIIQYTGGTTGRPKGAMLSHTNVVSNTQQIQLWLGEPDPAGEHFLAVLPFFHVFALSAIVNLGTAISAKITMLPRFDLQQTLQTIHRNKPTLFPGVPTLFAALNNDSSLPKYDLSSLKFCITGGAGLPVEVKRTFEKITGCQMVEGYGLTEASPVAACNPRHTGGKAGAIGLPLPGTSIEIRNMEDLTQPMPFNEKGELFIRGPQVMQGYWQRPDATDRTLLNGWLATGDIGHMDEDGYVFITDRAKDLIISNGYNIYPRVIEEILYQHPQVSEVAVIAIPDPHKGEVPKAFVTVKEKSSIEVTELLNFANQRLNPLEQIKELEIRESLPKTLIGKLCKKTLKEEQK